MAVGTTEGGAERIAAAPRTWSLGGVFVRYILPALSLGLLAFAISYVMKTKTETPIVPPPIAPARNPFGTSVGASGMVEAQTENISIGAPMPGIVTEVTVKVGQSVPKGTTLFKLDDRPYRAELKVRQAALAQAEAELQRLQEMPRKEQVPISEAQVREAEANLLDQQDQLKRMQELADKQFVSKHDGAMRLQVISEQEVSTRVQAVHMAEAQLAKAKAELDMLQAGAWESDKSIAKVAVERARSLVEQAQTELDRLEIKALVDGDVLQVNVRPGEFVGAPAGLPLIILGATKQLHVRVDIDEQDIPRYVNGKNARASVKGHPEVQFPLTFVRVDPYVVPKKSLTGLNTERVDTRVLQAIYAIDCQGQQLYVGQQLDVFIDAAQVQSAKQNAAMTR